jgi:hypothetical protein
MPLVMFIKKAVYSGSETKRERICHVQKALARRRHDLSLYRRVLRRGVISHTLRRLSVFLGE